MISISESSIDTVGSALLEGNFEFFIDQLPTTQAHTRNALEFNKVENYTDVLKSLMERTKPDGKCNLSRDEMHTLFDYAIGGVPSSPNKFTSLLKHHRIHTTRVRLDSDRVVYGIPVQWKDYNSFPQYKKILFPAPSAKPNPKHLVRVK